MNNNSEEKLNEKPQELIYGLEDRPLYVTPSLPLFSICLLFL